MLNKTNSATDCYNKGLLFLKTGDFAEAIAQLRTAAELCSEDEETFAALCLAVDESESEDSTFDGLMVRLWTLPDGAAFQQALAIDFGRRRIHLDAIVFCLQFVLISPDNVLSIYVLGRSYLAARNFESAKRSFRRALELEPDFAIARSKLNSSSTSLPVTQVRAHLESK